ncbi:M64 family metallopeptidase [Streptomyces sp. UNOC14_S4]|uniref:M64 family metallopeptidase n=1 Tax=Streptomyces sp. UNOC14_S4 TaxID=2872340 RepID=UPI001E3D0C77|nr:M64 family metallopeptidase [Streptomyces sp. UNOC14_S4]MCC3770850.1 M64 family metallopeptidase [Streptomyces sp. UNOC14_S4]
MRRRIRFAAVTAALAAVTVTAPVAAGAATPQPPQRTQSVEYFTGPDGHPRHTTVPASPAPPKSLRPSARGDGSVVPIVQNGPVANKLDVVFIGDGYTASQQGDFHAAVRAKWAKMSAVEPYASYRGLFNVWAVDVVSRESGVSGDPGKDVVKDTALRSAFFCDGVERLLCVDTGRVEAYAAKAPAADLVVVLSNSTKYGGAGYNDIVSKVGYDGIATASSDHPKSDQIAVHETGHSLGKLADEYQYDEYGTYTGAEPGEANISKLTAAQMTAQRQKWYRWIGRTSPDGGAVGAYEGGGYYPRGLFRPTENSIMRSLGREFNLPGREAMIAGFYRHASVLASERGTDSRVGRDDRLTVRVPADSVVVRWYVDGREIRDARGRTAVTPRSLGVPADGRAHKVTATAADTTGAVRDPQLQKRMQGSLTWETAR